MKEAIKTGASFILLIVLLSVCGWCAIPYPEETPPPKLVLPETVGIHVKDMAIETAIRNANLEKREAKR